MDFGKNNLARPLLQLQMNSIYNKLITETSNKTHSNNTNSMNKHEKLKIILD